MIVGVGIDLVPIDRMERALDKTPDRLEARLFTDREREYCRRHTHFAQHFAARFAAKEAFLKALRVPEGLSWHELEVVIADGGAPELTLTGVAKVAAEHLGVTHLHLSLSHSGGHAVAVVIAER